MEHWKTKVRLVVLISTLAVAPNVWAQLSFGDLLKQGLEKAIKESTQERSAPGSAPEGANTAAPQVPSNSMVAQAGGGLVDKGCTPESLQVDLKILDVRLGEADCSPTLMNFLTPGFVLKDFANVDPRLFGPAPGLVSEHVSRARELIASQPRSANDRGYHHTKLNLGGVKSIPSEYQGMVVQFLLLKAPVDAPKAIIFSVERKMCAPEADGIDRDTSLFRGYVEKYGQPTTVITYAADLKNAQAIYSQLEATYKAKIREDARYGQILRDGMIGAMNDLNRAKALAASRPDGVRGVVWDRGDKTVIEAFNEGGGSCPADVPSVRTTMATDSNAFRAVVEKATRDLHQMPRPEVAAPRL